MRVQGGFGVWGFGKGGGCGLGLSAVMMDDDDKTDMNIFNFQPGLRVYSLGVLGLRSLGFKGFRI